MRKCQKINLQEPQRNRKLCQFNNDQYCITHFQFLFASRLIPSKSFIIIETHGSYKTYSMMLSQD